MHRKLSTVRVALFALLAALASPAAAAAGAEIPHLLDYLDASGCRFERNGDLHEAKRARAHLERKLEHAMRREPGLSAEQFIEHAASASSFSGRPYRVLCPGERAVPSADWFGAELARHRAANAAARASD